jgi:class 3 adenylate cyclase/tetratricopeptide (TPR) repeat protein
VSEQLPLQLNTALNRLVPRQYIEQLLASNGRIAGERRVVTTLFFDIEGSTAMAENLDPEDVVEITNGAFETLIQPIYRYEGTLARLMGDGILAFFGAPIAHEDDAARACHAALEIIESARKYASLVQRRYGIADFNVRVGINTGLVVVGEVGTDLRVEYTAMGDAVNLASRMESAAESGTVLIAENTARLINRLFDTEDLGTIQVKGRVDPVRVFRLLRAKPKPITVTTVGEIRSPMVGRDPELKRLRGAVHALRDSRGGTCAVVGDTGLGKTRLVREVRESLKSDVTWIKGHCFSYTEGVSYWSARDMLQGLTGVGGGATSAEMAEALRAGIKHLYDGDNDKPEGEQFINRRDEMFAYLATLLNIPLDLLLERQVKSMMPEQLRRGILSSFCDYARRRSLEYPLVLVWEDVHWIDPSSLELLEALVRIASDIPLLIVLAFRCEEGRTRDFHERMLRDHDQDYQVIEVHPLERAESALMLRNLLQDATMPEDTFELILDSAEGNAFFLEEVLRWLRDAGLLTLSSGQAITARQIKDLGIPTTLHGAIMARLDRLPPSDKQTLQTASVIGRIFQRSLLKETIDDEIAVGQLDASLEQLRNQGFLNEHQAQEDPGNAGEQPQSPEDSFVWKTGPITVLRGKPLLEGDPVLSPDEEYTFTQAMTLEVTYNSLLKSQRKEFHRRAGAALEKIYPDRHGDLAPVLAYHMEKGGAYDRAFRYMIETARGAAKVYANHEAVACYEKALSLVQLEGDKIRSLLTEKGQSLAVVHEELGDVYYVVSEYQEALDQYEEVNTRRLRDILRLH